MRGYVEIAALPYRRVLYLDPSDGTPFIGERGYLTLRRPHEMNAESGLPEREALLEALTSVVERHDEENQADGAPTMAKLDRVAALNAQISMQMKPRERRYAVAVGKG